jgi:hypothetical protein
MDRHAATRRLRWLAASAGIQIAGHTRTCSVTYITTMLDVASRITM